MSPFSRSLIGSVVLHGGFFFGLSCLMIQDSQWGVDAGESGAAGAVAQEVEVSLMEPESEVEVKSEQEPVMESIVTDFNLPEVKIKVTEGNRPSLANEVPSFKGRNSSVQSARIEKSVLSSTLATGSGGARMANKADYDRNPPPAYPAESKKRGEEGVVVLFVELSENGGVILVNIDSSSGFKGLDRAAFEAVRRWKFQPAKIGGIGIKSSVKVPIRFQLEKIR